jgi:hypothetical protein
LFSQEVEQPENFTTNLFLWVKDNFDINDDEVYQFVTYGQICFPSGKCVDPDDVGAICCPF